MLRHSGRLRCSVVRNSTLVQPHQFWIPPSHFSQVVYTSGTILDEDTHAPIAGAKIFLTAHPEVRCESDFAGTFTLREIRQWHAGYMCVAAGASHWPHNDYWEPRITVSHTNYVLREINWEYRTTDVISLNKQTLVR